MLPTAKQRRILEAARATLNRQPPDEPRHPPTDEQRRILEDARATLKRRPEPDEPEPLRYKTHTMPFAPEAVPVQPETPDEVLYRTHSPEPEPEYQPRLDTVPSAMTAAWTDYIQTQIEQRVAQEREFTLAVMGEALGEGLADAREEHQKELRTLRAKFGRIEAAFAQLRGVIEVERARTIDLPNPLPRRDRDLN